MLTNGEKRQQEMLENSAYTQLLPASKTSSEMPKNGGEVEQLKPQSDAHIQVLHGDKMLLGVSRHFEQGELWVVLTTSDVDMHVFDTSVDPELITQYLMTCVIRAHAQLPLATKTNFGPSATFHDLDVFRDWLFINLKLILHMKTLWSARPGLLSTTSTTTVNTGADDKSNGQVAKFPSTHWDALSNFF